jgi:hypothetical protein
MSDALNEAELIDGWMGPTGEPDTYRRLADWGDESIEAFLLASGGKNPTVMLRVSRKMAPSGWLGVEVPEPPVLEFVAETWFHRLGKALSINVEHQSGDRRFDEAVYIHHNGMPALYLNNVLRERAAREAIMSLLQTSSIDLELRQTEQQVTISCRWPQGLSDHPLRGVGSYRVAQQLLAIAQGVPAVTPQHPQLRGSAYDLLVLASVCLLIGAGIFASIVSLKWIIISEARWAPSLLSAALWLVVNVALVLGLRGDSRSFGRIIVLSVLLSIVMPLLMIPSLKMLNALGDRAEPERREVVMVARWQRLTQGKNQQTFYYLKWREPGAEQAIEREVSLDLYLDAPDAGHRAVLLVGPGLLGWPWLKGIEERPDPAYELLDLEVRELEDQ